jgi:hypothetical protein
VTWSTLSHVFIVMLVASSIILSIFKSITTKPSRTWQPGSKSIKVTVVFQDPLSRGSNTSAREILSLLSLLFFFLLCHFPKAILRGLKMASLY